MRAELKAQARDARDLERWIDLLHYRQFRATLLRRKGTCGPAPDDLTLVGRCWAAGALRPVERRPSLDVGVTEAFITASGTKITADEPVLKAALLEIGKSWPGGVSFEELAVRVLARLSLRRIRTEDLDESQRRALASDLVALQTLGHLELRVRPLDCAQQPPAQPAVTALTRFEAETHGWVSTPWHAAVPLDPLDRELVQALDGSRNIDALVELTCRAVREERVSILLEDGQSPDEDAMRRIVPRLLGQKMLRFAAHGLLRPER